MTAPLHTIPLPAGDDGDILRRFLAASVAAAHREGLVVDRCSPAGLLARSLELWADGRVVLRPE